MSIKKRMILASAIFLSLFLTREIVNWLGNNSVMRKNENAYHFKDGTMHLQGIFRGVNEFIIDEGEPLSVELTKKNLEGFEEVYNIINDEVKDTEFHHILVEKIEPQWQIVKNGVISFLKIEDISVEDTQAMLKYGKLITEGNILLKEIESLADKTQEVAKATAKRTKYIIYIVASVILVLLTLLLLSLYRSILSPIKDLNVITEGFKNGDLRLRMNDRRKDEFGILASHFNKAIVKLSDMILNVKEVAATLTLNSDEISESSLEIAKNSQEQSSQMIQTVSAMQELNTSFIDVANNTNAAAESSKNASVLATKGGTVVEENIKGMEKISQSVNYSANNIEALRKRSEQIGEIIDVINDIAGQTNLLALNAAIEAARAGEQGRGFAVVADEVRKLAERTTSSTNEIGDMIRGMQNDTDKAVESMKAGTLEVEQGVNLANEAGESLKQIMQAVENVTDMSQQIATAAEEQSSTGEEITTTVESVANSIQYTADNSQKSASATQKLNELVQQLQQLVSGFKLQNHNIVERENHSENYIQQSVDIS
jgi:methyl-accepting chemotaxis protein